MEKKTCFVVIGYGEKMDHLTGRKLNLANSYANLIEPVCSELGLYCFRASDRNYENSGFIDSDMFDYLLKSDLVIADVSTLNPNAIYELGIRHALRPYSTIIIAEEGTTIPFDFGRNVIEKYKHLGEDIGVTEASRFKALLNKKIESVLSGEKVDSPVYTMLPYLEPPTFSKEEIKEILADERENKKKDQSLAQYIKDAELAKNDSQFSVAKFLFQKALEIAPNEIFLKQRLALVTYKSKEPDHKSSLLDALNILEEIGNMETTEIETLGLSGAVYKRLYELDKDQEYLDNAIKFYKRGFCIGQDYYNGINLAFILLLRAVKEQVIEIEKQTDFQLAKRTRAEVKNICLSLTTHTEFTERPKDQQLWVLLTLAEIAFVEEDLEEERRLIECVQEMSPKKFYLDSYHEQRKKLETLLVEYRTNNNQSFNTI